MTNLFGNWANVSLHLRLLKTNITGIFLSFFLFFYPLTHFISHDSFNLTHFNNRIKEQKMRSNYVGRIILMPSIPKLV